MEYQMLIPTVIVSEVSSETLTTVAVHNQRIEDYSPTRNQLLVVRLLVNEAMTCQVFNPNESQVNLSDKITSR